MSAIRNRLAGALVAALITAGALTGCTAPTDPFVEVVKTTATEAGFTDSGRMASGCVGVTLFCMQPMYEPIFYIPESAGSVKACDALFKISNKLGALAYSLTGEYPARIEPGSNAPKELCIQGLGKPLINSDGSELYQGIVLYDDGSKDSFGKVYNLIRGDSEFGKVFQLIISFSKDQTRIGPILYGNETPKLKTQDELDAGNAANEIAAETMKLANTLLGQAEKYAITRIEDAGYTYVVIARDQEEFVYDQQYDPRRIRLTIKEGIIYDAIAG